MNKAISIIPRPSSCKALTGKFKLNSDTKIQVDSENVHLAYQLVDYLYPATGYRLDVVAKTEFSKNTISIRLNSELSDLGPEGYQLKVAADSVLIEAFQKNGLFYGIQTLRQLLPAQIYRSAPVAGVAWEMPCVEIKDKPRFVWRSMHLDVCRHFIPKEFLKKYIDLLAMHKMNTFHWHLTDDQGWRIEIKKYPRLTEVSSWRKQTLIGHALSETHEFDGKPHGGYYTQDDVREIVAYAQERFINVVPEIEMPGHCQSVLAAYPEFACEDKEFDVCCVWGIIKEVYCAGNDAVFEFNQEVLKEVMELFPSKYIHVGGDEVPKDRWKACPKCQARIKSEGLKDENELQSYFIKRIEAFINEQGRIMIGWDEILEGGLAPNAVVMSWRGTEAGITAAKSGHDVIMSPVDYCYFDFYQGKDTDAPLAIGGYLPLEKVYSYDPVPESFAPEQAKRILGAQANVWTEYMPTLKHLENMTYPRALALAEVDWTLPENKDYADFTQRLEVHLQRLNALDVNYYKPNISMTS